MKKIACVWVILADVRRYYQPVNVIYYYFLHIIYNYLLDYCYGVIVENKLFKKIINHV